MSKFALPVMKQGSGQIIIVSTAAKRLGRTPLHHASKWGLLGFSHALHVEARPHNIKVTALVAGGMQTPSWIDSRMLVHCKTVAETIRFCCPHRQGTVIPE